MPVELFLFVSIVKHFVYELAHLWAKERESFPSLIGDVVVLPNFPLNPLRFTPKVSGSFQSMKYGIQRSRAHVIAVAHQLLNHFKAVDRRLCCMVQQVDTDERKKYVAEHVGHRYRVPIQKIRST
jgi:hypothetical protein